MVVSGILLLANRFVGLGLTLLGPVLFNILVFHILMQPGTIGMGAFATLLWLLVAWHIGRYLKGCLRHGSRSDMHTSGAPRKPASLQSRLR